MDNLEYSPEAEQAFEAKLQNIAGKLDEEADPILRDRGGLLGSQGFLSRMVGDVSWKEIQDMAKDQMKLKAQAYGARSGDLARVRLPNYLDFQMKQALKEVSMPVGSSEGRKALAMEKYKRLESIKKGLDNGQNDVVRSGLMEEQRKVLEDTSRMVHAYENPDTDIGRSIRQSRGSKERAVIRPSVDYVALGYLIRGIK